VSAAASLRAAQQFAHARHASAQAQLLALLHPQARYETPGRQAEGAQAVAAELLQAANAGIARRLDWSEPQAVGTQVRLTGTRRAGTRDRGLVVTLTFEGDAIALVQEQRTPAPPVDAQAIQLPQDLRRRIDHALAERHPMLVAHVDEQGQPILNFRGSVQAFSDDQLALWVRNAQGGFVQAIARNPRIALMYRDEDAKATYQFQGRARVTQDAAERRRIFDAAPPAERAHDFAMLGAAIVVDLDRVEGYAGLGPQGPIDPIRQLRDAA
jgi:hypothetical protein